MNDEIFESYKKQIEKYEKLSFEDAKKLLKYSLDKDENIKKETIAKVFKGTLYLVLKFIKNSRYEVIKSYGYDLEDVINIAYELWYEKVSSFEILKYEDTQRVLGITFANELVVKVIPCEEELEAIYPCNKDLFISLLEFYIKLRNNNSNLTYREFVDKYVESHINSYYGYGIYHELLNSKYCANMLERIYQDLSNNDQEYVKINKLSLQKISKLLALSSQTYPLSDGIESTINFEEDIMTKICYEQIHKLVFENMSLNEREKDVIALRFGFYGNKQHNFEEIGNKYGKSRERIRQIEAKTLRKLRRRNDLSSLYKSLYKND